MGRADQGRQKKLTEAAEAWVTGDDGQAGSDAAIEALRRAGAPPDVLAAEQRKHKARTVLVWPDNWPALCLFLAAASQWRFAGGLGAAPVGLDYQGVEAAARMEGLTVTPDSFARLRVLESAAIGAMARRRPAGRGKNRG